MNIFVLDLEPRRCAQYHCDDHVKKMIIESTQMLSTANRMFGLKEGYKIAFPNHRCNVWVRQSLDNWLWLRELTYFLNEEYRKRYNKEINHKSWLVARKLSFPNIRRKGLTPFALAMPDKYKSNNAVYSYRRYYRNEKTHLLRYTNREIPFWLKRPRLSF